jgi:hypothetical protein
MKVQDLNASEVKWLGQMQEGGRILAQLYLGSSNGRSAPATEIFGRESGNR